MKRTIRMISVILLGVMLIAGSAIPIYANSAQTHWRGTTASGTLVTGENCPLEVKSELLTFDIQTFPQLYYYNSEESAYNASVTAKYTFYNPADYTVDATLVFPFGEYPDYEQWYTDESGEYVRGDNTAKYHITLNGEAIEKKLRHTFSTGNFSASADMAKLCDGYASDSFFTPETTVTEYNFQISGIQDDQTSAYISAPLQTDGSKTKIIMSPNNGYHTDDNEVRVGTWASNGESITIYAIGEPLSSLPVWTVYENGAEKNVISGNAEYMPGKEQTYTFSKLAMCYFNSSGTVSETDWYNAEVDNLNANAVNDSGFLGGIHILDIRNRLMRWYEYDMTVPAKSEIINEVTAPLYPSVRTDYEPPVYGYTYLLSPAQTWASFGTFDIVVNSPFYMTEDNQTADFTKTDNGYTLSFDSLPDGELTFTLSSGENPKRIVNYSYLVFYIPFIIAGVILIGLAITAIIFIRIRKRKAKEHIN